MQRGGTSEVNLGISVGSWTLRVKEAEFESRERSPLREQRVFTERTQKFTKTNFCMYSLDIEKMFSAYLPLH